MAAFLIGFTLACPLLGAVAAWWVGEKRPRTRPALAAVSAGGTGLATLVLLFVPLEETAYVTQSVAFFVLLVVGIGCLALAGQAWRTYRDGETDGGAPYALWLFFISACIGVSVLQSTLLVYLSFCLLVYCVYRLLTRNDLVNDIQTDVREHMERHRYD